MLVPDPAGGPPSDKMRSALSMVAAVTTFTVMQVFIKELTQGQAMPVAVVVFLRMAFGSLAGAPWLMRHGLGAMRTERLMFQFLRALLGVTALTCFTFGIANLLFADAVALAFTTPLWSIVIASVVLREAARMRRWSATVIGFCGVLLIVQPTGEVNPWMLVALLGAISGCGVFIVLRKLAAEPVMVTSLYSHFFAVAMLAPFAIWFWQTPTAYEWLLLALTGVLSFVGQALFASAFAQGEVGVVAPLEYLRMPLAVLFGVFFFAEVPSLTTLAGIAIIAVASVYIVRREAQLSATP